MQGPIATALSLVSAGNAYLRGERIDGYWPEAEAFRFSKICEFRTPPESGEDWPLLADTPEAWFEKLKPWCKGLRLHTAPHQLQSGQLPGMSERMMVGFVGGGPRWLIEARRDTASEIWEGALRLGDREDPQQKIWLSTFLKQGDMPVDADEAVQLAPASAQLAAALPKIEAFAREIGETGFADVFKAAQEALALSIAPAVLLDSDLAVYGHVRDARLSVLMAIEHAWVFGGMGSWNDTGGGEARYETLSEELFRALCACICGLANSTFGQVTASC